MAAAILKVQRYADVMERYVIPKDANSKLLQQVELGKMPKYQPKLPVAEIATLKDWILQGAPNWEPSPKGIPRTFVSEAQILQLIQSDLQKQSDRSRAYLRYYSIVHLYNSLVSDEDLEQYRIGLSKLVNSLSRMPKIVRPTSINQC